jgi:hypothetical protein
MSTQRGHPRYEQWALAVGLDPASPATETQFVAVYDGEHVSVEAWARNDREKRGESQSGAAFDKFVRDTFHEVQGTHFSLQSEMSNTPGQSYVSHFVYRKVAP